MRRKIVAIVAAGLLGGAMAACAPAQQDPSPPKEGVGERIGEKFDRGVSRLGSTIRQGWAEVRQTVDKLGVQGRVYGRLRWDKALTTAAIEVEVHDGDVVVLRGSVPDAAAREAAVRLAEDTVGVGKVVDELALAPNQR